MSNTDPKNVPPIAPFLREIELVKKLVNSAVKLREMVRTPWKLMAALMSYFFVRFGFLNIETVKEQAKSSLKRFILGGKEGKTYENAQFMFNLEYKLAMIESLHRAVFSEEELEPVTQNALAIKKNIKNGDTLMSLTKRLMDNYSIFYVKTGTQRFVVDGIEYLTIVIPKDTIKFRFFRGVGVIPRTMTFEFGTGLYFVPTQTSAIQVPITIKRVGDMRFKKVSFSTGVKIMSNSYRRETIKLANKKQVDRKKNKGKENKKSKEISDDDDIDTSEEVVEDEILQTTRWSASWSETTVTGYTDLDNVIIPTELRRKIRKEIEQFGSLIALNDEIPNRKSYLLYGPPGTGKTTLAISIGAIYSLPVYVIDDYKHMNQRNLRDFVAECASKKPCVLLFEECEDLLLHYEEMGIDKSTMTSILDGTLSSGQMFTIFTTNLDISEFDGVDPAIMRRGRIDQKYNFDITDKKELVRCISTSTNVNFSPDDFNDNLSIVDVRECQFIRMVEQQNAPQSDVSDQVREEILDRFGNESNIVIED